MSSPIQSLGSPLPPSATNFVGSLAPLDALGTGESSVAEAGGFGQLLNDALENVVALDNDAHAKIEDHLTGGDVQLAEVFTSVKKADLALRTMIQVRNKLMDAYREIQQLRM